MLMYIEGRADSVSYTHTHTHIPAAVRCSLYCARPLHVPPPPSIWGPLFWDAYRCIICRTSVRELRSHRQGTPAYVSIRQHTSAYVSIRQHMSAYVSIRQHASFSSDLIDKVHLHASAYISIRQHTSAYVLQQRSHLQGTPERPQ